MTTAWEGKRRIPVVSAVMTRSGLPDLVLTEVEVTHEEALNGVHYYFVEAELMKGGYDEPFVHFAEGEGPPFLHAAVRAHLGLPAVADKPLTISSEVR
jgi:hypothetical protein